MVFTHSLVFIFPFVSSMTHILFQYLTLLLFSHSPNHSPSSLSKPLSLHSPNQSPFTLPFSSNRSHFCLVTLFSSDPTIDLPSFFQSFSNSTLLFHSLLLRSLALFQSLSYFLSILTLSFSLLLSIALLPFNHIFSLTLLPLSITHSFTHLLSLIVVTLIVSRYLSFMIFYSCSVFSCSLYLSHTHTFSPTTCSQFFHSCYENYPQSLVMVL